MLNISKHTIKSSSDVFNYPSLRGVEGYASKRVFVRIVSSFLGILFVSMFLPWTQNIQSKGNVTALKPEQRPQTIQSRISGRIEHWYVREGAFVKKGDTILNISEIKSEYLDPDYLERIGSQLAAKKSSVKSYEEKVQALENQIIAIERTSALKSGQINNKLEQGRLQIESDSIEYEASKIAFEIADRQYKRLVKLYEEGLKSLTDLEKRRQDYQKAQAQMVAKENKLLASRNKFLNIEIENTSVIAQYQEKAAKAQSDKFATLSNLYDAEAMVTKLQNQYANFSMRTDMYYITAPLDGYINRVIQTGIGETIKEGAKLVDITPASYDLAVAMYIKPIDLPLLEKGQKVRIQFDGWPAIVFSGWPNTSYGTYGGVVVAIDNNTSANGMFRVIVAQDPDDYIWPDAIRMGAGTKNMLLLKDVPIGYELWRKINGFPPDYYKTNEKQASK